MSEALAALVCLAAVLAMFVLVGWVVVRYADRRDREDMEELARLVAHYPGAVWCDRCEYLYRPDHGGSERLCPACELYAEEARMASEGMDCYGSVE